MAEWQPIETAPRQHGEPILVSDAYGSVALVFWMDPKETLVEQSITEGWYISDWHNDPIWFRGHLDVTKWAPVPQAPKQVT